MGANTINNAASDRKVSIKLAEGDTVHVQCCAKFTNMKYIQIFLRKKQNKETLMKSLKSPAGCTRGLGVDETQTAVWTAIAPLVAQINLKIRKMSLFGIYKCKVKDGHCTHS